MDSTIYIERRHNGPPGAGNVGAVVWAVWIERDAAPAR